MQVVAAVQQYLKQKNWKYRDVNDGENIAIRECPYCGKSKWKFCILASNGVFKCWHCSAKGNLYVLKKYLGDLKVKGVQDTSDITQTKKGSKRSKLVPMEHIDRWHTRLLQEKQGLDYVQGRGITLEAILHFKLGLQLKDGVEWLVIPHLAQNKCLNVKFRNITPNIPKEDKWRRTAGHASILFNEDTLLTNSKIVLVEAEIDAISAWCAGVKNVVSLTAGAGTFASEWYDQLCDKEEIIIALDDDVPGQKGAKDIGRRLGFDKTSNVVLPLHDMNDVLLQLGPDAVVQALKRSKKFDVVGVLPIRDVLAQCVDYRESGEPGLDTPWAEVNAKLGRDKFQGGDLVILSATPKTGKTTWATNILLHQAVTCNIPSMMYCLEMKPTRLGDKIVAIVRETPTDELQPIDYKLAQLKILKAPLFLIDPAWTSKISAEAVFDKIRETVKRYGIKFVVFDHLHFLCRSLQHMTNEVGNVTKGFKLLAEELDIVMFLIAQPGKVKGNKVMSRNDLKHSSDIPADADWIIILHRDEIPAGSIANSGDSDQSVLDPKTLIRIDGARFQGGGEVYLHFEGARSKFMPMSERPAAVF